MPFDNTYMGLGAGFQTVTVLSNVGGGSTVTSTQAGSLFLAGGASSGQIHRLPRPELGLNFEFIFLTTATSAASIIRTSSASDVLLANGNLVTTENAVQLRDVNHEAAARIVFYGVSDSRYIAVPGGGQFSSAHTSADVSTLAKLWNTVASSVAPAY